MLERFHVTLYWRPEGCPLQCATVPLLELVVSEELNFELHTWAKQHLTYIVDKTMKHLEAGEAQDILTVLKADPTQVQLEIVYLGPAPEGVDPELPQDLSSIDLVTSVCRD